MGGQLKIVVLVLSALISAEGLKAQHNKVFAEKWAYLGIAVEEPGYTIWGTSPIIGDDGKTHLFVARWPCELKVDPGWRSHSEIAHYIGDSPEGPFHFSDVALTGTGKDTWDRFGAHNPAIHKAGDYYVLLYIGNDNPTSPYHGPNQKIGMVVSKDLSGPWQKAGTDGKILDTPSDPDSWNYQSTSGVNNPAFLQHPDGRFFLYFKSQGSKMGLAISENLTGPYIQLANPVTTNKVAIEDGYAFIYKNKICLLTTDNHGLIEEGGGILWKSEDGIHFDEREQGFKRLSDYIKVDMAVVATHYGPANSPYVKFERPQVLMINGKPGYLYAPSGRNIYGGDCTISHILKFIE